MHIDVDSQRKHKLKQNLRITVLSPHSLTLEQGSPRFAHTYENQNSKNSCFGIPYTGRDNNISLCLLSSLITLSLEFKFDICKVGPFLHT